MNEQCKNTSILNRVMDTSSVNTKNKSHAVLCDINPHTDSLSLLVRLARRYLLSS